jgi:hypothetical protein
LACSREVEAPKQVETAPKAIVHNPGDVVADEVPAAVDPERAAAGTRRWHEAAAAIPDLPAYVRAKREELAAEQADLIVYVGATWCEPCRYFHDAVLRGELEDSLGRTHFLAFDLDQHREALHAAGYRDRLIPLFAWPDAQGKASTNKFSGGIKGPGAVHYIRDRLQKLLNQRPVH